VEKDQSKGTNYHKVSEYLVYGRSIVSNYVSAYDFEGSGVDMIDKSFEYNVLIKKIKKTGNIDFSRSMNSLTYSEILFDILKNL
jgi:hypothetical protein